MVEDNVVFYLKNAEFYPFLLLFKKQKSASQIYSCNSIFKVKT